MKNKKIGIVTLNGEFNYGNRLQNFALQLVLSEFNADVCTLEIKNSKFDKIKKEFWNGNIGCIGDIYYLSKKIISKLTFSSIKKRKNYRLMQAEKLKIIEKFTKENIKVKKINRKHLNEFQSNYDLFIVGSDQVWNPNIIEFDSTHFLNFTAPEKRYSYSASFGVDELLNSPSLLKEHYKNYLTQMSYISVREDSGTKIVEQLLHKTIDTAPDPTLLLNKNEWKKALQIKDCERKPFILVYFVSEISEKILNKITDFAKKKNLEILQIMGDTFGEDRVIVDPKQFVEMIYQAQYVFTDSFHGSVFSIIMETPFFVFKRTDNKGTYTRIDSLVSKFNIECAIVTDEAKLSGRLMLFNFESTRYLLEEERKGES
ncbi:MAG: polysaccharide pyruvyl transferase family protein [Enterococcus lacertideformus]|uniref:Polysaccharide pyruvyl transferase family protein n=1 Tax=Enterococcus lacertideformus TaxID=2771493 RepID=A0A931AX76_9ENTE|nr:polysaccharide pyruvyl transferase family protein [Enterococcus lacertideformus]